MNYLRRCTRNIQILPLTKVTKLMSASYLFSFISACCRRTKWNLVRGDFGQPVNTDGFWWERWNYSGLWTLWWCKQNANWKTLSYSSNCSIFRAKKLETISATKKEQKLKNGKVRFCLNIDVRKEMEDSRLNAIKQLITFVKGRLNFSCKSTTAATVDFTNLF